MREISLREFQLKANNYLNNLPITLTRYGKPVAIVNTFNGSVNTSVDEFRKLEEEVEKEVGKLENSEEKLVWCELHFEKGKTYPCKLISWEDENGTVIIDKKLACPTCLAKYENMGRGKVIYE